jgi:Ca2+-binding EF-hand superfamily protein
MKFILFTAMLVAAATPLCAADAPPDDCAARVAFAYTDRDIDGRISLEEYRNRAVRMFLGTNGEAMANVGGKPKKFDDLRKDVSLKQLNAAVRVRFAQIDTNHDGYLSLDEWLAMPEAQPRNWVK